MLQQLSSYSREDSGGAARNHEVRLVNVKSYEDAVLSFQPESTSFLGLMVLGRLLLLRA